MEQIPSFRDLGISAEILQALEQKGYHYPTKIQAEAIPHLLAWRDVIAKAPTGTGKTFAFGIPMLEHIDATSTDLQGLVLAPTRELAIQICDELRVLASAKKGVRIAVVYGGQKIESQERSLQKKPQIVVATPGRLMDHYNRKNLRLDKIHSVVLDEADRMLDMGFFKDVTKILDRIKIVQPVKVAGVEHPKKHLDLFSATISEEVMTVSWMYQRDEVEITVKAEAQEKPDIDQFSMQVPPLEKTATTLQLIRTCGYEHVIIFCNTKVMCQRLSDDLRRAGLNADCIHGDINQSARERTMKTFRDGKLAILIATDVASRGIDVEDVDCVINFDIPDENEYYIHRIGRTGRARHKGVAWSILGNLADKIKLDEIAKFSHFQVKAMRFLDNGELAEAEKTKPVIRKKFR
ncbi:MAG: DEAD/DEAH box helicase [Oscillospiraceae bacterium]|nr:DEAD/DEAH box helicase [Oscillospiraceae bacterium]